MTWDAWSLKHIVCKSSVNFQMITGFNFPESLVFFLLFFAMNPNSQLLPGFIFYVVEFGVLIPNAFVLKFSFSDRNSFFHLLNR